MRLCAKPGVSDGDMSLGDAASRSEIFFLSDEFNTTKTTIIMKTRIIGLLVAIGFVKSGPQQK